MIRIIVKHYGVECIIVNIINNKIYIHDNKRFIMCIGVIQG